MSEDPFDYDEENPFGDDYGYYEDDGEGDLTRLEDEKELILDRINELKKIKENLEVENRELEDDIDSLEEDIGELKEELEEAGEALEGEADKKKELLKEIEEGKKDLDKIHEDYQKLVDKFNKKKNESKELSKKISQQKIKTKLPEDKSKKFTNFPESQKNPNGEDVGITREEEDSEYYEIMEEIEREKERIRKSNLSKEEKSRKLKGIENAIEELDKLNTQDGNRPLREKEAPGTLRAVWNAYKRADFQSEIGDGIGQAVHHLDGYNWAIDKRIDPTNLILLSEDIHTGKNGFHKLYGYGNNTLEQFLEYIYTYYPKDAPSFVEKYVKNGVMNVDDKLKEANSSSWGSATRQTQFNRSMRLPVLENLHDLDFNPVVGSIPYSSFFLKHMEIPIDGSYEKYGRTLKSAQLSTSNKDILKIYDDDTEAKLKSYEEKKGGKGLNELRNILTARRIVESSYGLYDEKSIDELLGGDAFKKLGKADLLKELKDSHNIGRKRLEKRVSGELPMPFLGGEYSSIDLASLDDVDLGGGLFVVLDKLEKFFEEYKDFLGFEYNPLEGFDSKEPITHNSRNEEILQWLFEGEDPNINHLSARFTHKLPVESNGVIESDRDRIRKFRDDVANQPPHQKPSRLDKFDDVRKDLLYLLAISRRGVSAETIARFFNSEGYRRRIVDPDDRNALNNDTKPNGKGVRGTVNKPETDTSKNDAKMGEMNQKIGGRPTIVRTGDLILQAKDVREGWDDDDIRNKKENTQTVHVEGNKEKTQIQDSEEKLKETIKLSDIKGISTFIPELNKQLELLRNAVLDAVGYMRVAFGYQPDKKVSEMQEEYKDKVSDMSPREFLRISNGASEKTTSKVLSDEDKLRIRKESLLSALNKKDISDETREHIKSLINNIDAQLDDGFAEATNNLLGSKKEVFGSAFHKIKFTEISSLQEEYDKAVEKRKSLRNTLDGLKSEKTRGHYEREIEELSSEISTKGTILREVGRNYNDYKFVKREYRGLREIINNEVLNSGLSEEEIESHPLVKEAKALEELMAILKFENTEPNGADEEISRLKEYIKILKGKLNRTSSSKLAKEYEQKINDAEYIIKTLEMGDVESFQNDYYAQGIPEKNPFVQNLSNIMQTVYREDFEGKIQAENRRSINELFGFGEGKNGTSTDWFGVHFNYLKSQYEDLKSQILPLQNVVINPNVSDETKEEFDALVGKIKKVHDALMGLRTNDSFNVGWEDELNEIIKGYEGVALSVDEVIKREEVLDALYGEEFKKVDARNRQGINELFGFDKDYGVDPKYTGKELKDNTKAIESPLNLATSSLSKFAWQFDRATYSATQLNGVVTKLFAIVGSGSAVNDMITASSLRQTNQIMLASRRGMQEAEKLYDRIQMLVVKLPGNDTFLTNILTMLGTMDESLTAEDLEYMGGIIADYYMGAQAKGQFNNETERELRNYLMTGQTRNLTNSIIASEVESLKNLNSVKERTMALEKALQTTGMDSIAHYKSYHNTLEEFKGRFQKSFADLGDLYLGFLQGLMEVYNFLDSISGSFLSQLTISLGVFALGALGLTVALAQVIQTVAGTVDAIKHLKKAVETGEGLEGKYGEAIRKTIAWILFKIGIINEETASKIVNTDATLRNTVSEKWNSLSIKENIGSKVASTIAWFGNTKQKVVARLETYKNILATKLETLNTWIETGSVIANTKAWANNTKEKAKNKLVGYNDRIKGFLGGKLGVESTWGSIFGDVFGRGVNMLFKIGEAIVKFLRTPLGEIVGIVGTIIAIIVLAVRYIGQLFGWWSSFGEMFQAIGDGIRRTWEAFVNSEPIQYMITTFQNFAYTLEGVFNLIRDIGGSIWEMIFGVDKGGNKVFDIVGAFLEFIGAIGNIAFMISPIKIILDIINAIGSAIAWALDTWNEFIDSAEFQGLLKDFQEIRGIIGEAWGTLTGAFNEVRDAFMSVFEDDDEVKEMVENTNILLEVLKAVAMFLRVTVVPVVKLIAYIIKGVADAIKFIVDIGTGVVDFFTGGALTNEASSLPTQKQLAQSYSNRVNNTQTIVNNNFASGSVLTDARNMTAKEVMKLFTSAFGFNKSRGVNGVLS